VDEDSDNEIKRMILRVINERKEVTRIAWINFKKIKIDKWNNEIRKAI
jgi:hypothetical protein